MTASTPLTTVSTARWTQCVRCQGEQVEGYDRCIAHLTAEEREAYLATLHQGGVVSHRGTTITVSVLAELVAALRGPHPRPLFGDATFIDATFDGDADFHGVTFSGDADFCGATFNGVVDFDGATFSGRARFRDATFSGKAGFGTAEFRGVANLCAASFREEARFGEATFVEEANFGGVAFRRGARFSAAKFAGGVSFIDTTFDGNAEFGSTEFDKYAEFSFVTFGGDADFRRAVFSAHARFRRAEFRVAATFGMLTFNGGADFSEARFADRTWFGWLTFAGPAIFSGAEFAADAMFYLTEFAADIEFVGVTVGRNATFVEAKFSEGKLFGPLICQGAVDLSRAVFIRPITLEVAATGLHCVRTVWSDTATLRVRHARVDLTDAILTAPVEISAHARPFVRSVLGIRMPSAIIPEGELGEIDDPVRLASVRGVDAGHLVLSDIQVDECLFTGAFHLDQLRLEGEVGFAQPPTGWCRRGLMPSRWSRRRTLVEEHYWRGQAGYAGWAQLENATSVGSAPRPAALAITYRALRKALEDRGDAPGAADFYYGEMDMRRHSPGATHAERGLLYAYWLMSGYGLRGSRALASLVLIMAMTVLVIMLFGLPSNTPEPVVIGDPMPDGQIILHTNTPPAELPAWGERLTGDRAGTTLPIVLEAVVFRAADTNLTPIGVYVDMVARLAEPALLALAVLAIRGRLKR
jgi:uncharacterized protein YjbI with pentapeptide repeats